MSKWGLDDQIRKNISDKLRTKIKTFQCPMCSNNNFVMGEAYFNNYIQIDLRNVRIGGPTIPSIPIICANCGFISQHALGVLGILPDGSSIKEGGK